MRTTVLITLSFLTLACTDAVMEPAPEYDALETRVAAEGAHGPWKEAIHGSGHFYATSYYAPGGPVWRTFTINARKARDGSVDGRFQVTLHLKDGVHISKGEVVCFSIVGNMAWIGAHKEGNDPPDLAFQVADHGEGSGDTPDEVGLYGEASYWGLPAGTAETFCEETSDYFFIPGLGNLPLASIRYPIEAGNIQILKR
jgi:hypothetical protein